VKIIWKIIYADAARSVYIKIIFSLFRLALTRNAHERDERNERRNKNGKKAREHKSVVKRLTPHRKARFTSVFFLLPQAFFASTTTIPSPT
jgi:hypothetical protein